MSVLETFYILFKSDADKAAEGLDKVEDAADGAERSLNKADKATKSTSTSARNAAASTAKLSAATKAADANATRLAGSFMNVAKAAAAPLLALLSVGSIAKMTIGRAENIRELDQFSAKLNSSIQDVDAFQRSVQQLGGEGSRALDSLVKIGERFNEAFSDKDSGARKDFTEWGLSFKDSEGNALGATDAMLALAGSIETVSRAEALARIKKLGIEDAATIELILKGRKEVERFIGTQKEMGVVTEQQAEITREYYAALGSLGNQLTTVGNNMVATFLPAITGGLEGLSGLLSWMSENQTLVEGFFIGVSGVVTAYFLPALGSAAAAVIAATWPFLLLGAAAIAIGMAFALAYEDVKAFLNGQPSLIGSLVEKYEWFADIVRKIGDAFNWVKDQWNEFSTDVLGSQDKLGAFWEWYSTKVTEFTKALVGLGGEIVGFFAGVVTNAINGVIDLVGTLIDKVMGAALAVATLASSGASGSLEVAGQGYAGGANPAAAADFIRGLQSGQGSVAAPSNGLQAAQGALNGAANAPQGLAAGDTITRNTTVNVGTVEVNTQATDAIGMAAAAKVALQRELGTAAAGFDDGVDR